LQVLPQDFEPADPVHGASLFFDPGAIAEPPQHLRARLLWVYAFGDLLLDAHVYVEVQLVIEIGLELPGPE
jgi:hypothetical protein